MFKFALLSCFLVSLDCASCAHIFAEKAISQGAVKARIILEEIPQSELSTITFQYAISSNIDQDGVVSKSSSASTTTNSFTNEQELEEICKTIKDTLSNINGNAKIKITVKTSIDRKIVHSVFHRCFGFIDTTVGEQKPIMTEEYHPSFSFPVKEKESRDVKPEPKCEEVPCGVFATHMKSHNNEKPDILPKYEHFYNRWHAKKRNMDNSVRQYKKSAHGIRWNATNSDKDTVLLGRALEYILSQLTEQRVDCEITDGMFTIYARNSWAVLDAIQFIKDKGGVQNTLRRLGQTNSEFQNIQNLEQRFDEIFSAEYKEIVQRNLKPNKSRYHFRRLYDTAPWFF